MNTTGNRLRRLREDRGLTQAEVANRLGIQRVTYLKYETGENKPVRKLNELADFFNVSIDYLLGNDENPKSKSNEFVELSKDERQLLSIYREIPKDKRSSTMSIFKTLAESFGASSAV